MLAKPQMWYPGIDRQHPLARSLIGYWPLWEMQSTKRVVNLAAFSQSGILTDTTWTGTPWGPALNHAALDASVNCGNIPAFNFGASDFSVVCGLIPAAPGDQTAYGVFVCQGRATIDGWYFQMWDDANRRRLNFYVRTTISGDNHTTVDVDVLTSGVPNVVVAVRRANLVYIYVNGVEASSYASQPAVTGATVASANNFYIGRYQLAGTDYDGKTLFVGVYKRALSEGELQSLTRDPYAFLRLRRRIPLIETAGAPDQDLTWQGGGMYLPPKEEIEVLAY